MRYLLGDTLLHYKATSGVLNACTAPRFSSGVSRRASRSSARFKVYALAARFPFTPTTQTRLERACLFLQLEHISQRRDGGSVGANYFSNTREVALAQAPLAAVFEQLADCCPPLRRSYFLSVMFGLRITRRT